MDIIKYLNLICQPSSAEQDFSLPQDVEDDFDPAVVADPVFFGICFALADFALDVVDLDTLDAEDTAETMLPTSDSLSDMILIQKYNK